MKLLNAVGIFISGVAVGMVLCPVTKAEFVKIEPNKEIKKATKNHKDYSYEEVGAKTRACRYCKHRMCSFSQFMECGKDNKLFVPEDN